MKILANFLGFEMIFSVAHGCGDGMEACDQMKATCFDATIQSNKVGQFEGQLRDNRCAICQQGDLCNVPEKLPAAENPHKCWDTDATEQIEGRKTILNKIDCGLEAIGCYTINGPDGKGKLIFALYFLI